VSTLAATSTVTNSGTTQTLVVDVYFKLAFAGPNSINLLSEAEGGRYSAPAIMGSWTVTADPNVIPLRPVSVTPSSGSGYSQQFVFTSTNPAGASNLLRTYVQFASQDSTSTCYVVFTAAERTIYLLNDTMTECLKGIVLGTTGSVENSQCRINTGTSSVPASGNTQTLTLGMYFKPRFTGAEYILAAVETYSHQYSSTYVLGTWRLQ
jgi:hypothetical protein